MSQFTNISPSLSFLNNKTRAIEFFLLIGRFALISNLYVYIISFARDLVSDFISPRNPCKWCIRAVYWNQDHGKTLESLAFFHFILSLYHSPKDFSLSLSLCGGSGWRRSRFSAAPRQQNSRISFTVKDLEESNQIARERENTRERANAAFTSWSCWQRLVRYTVSTR